MSRRKIVFLDTETTSLVEPYRVNGRRIWEVGFILHDFQQMVGPTGPVFEPRRWSDSCFLEVDLTFADPFSLNVGKFWERHPQGKSLSSLSSTTGEGTKADILVKRSLFPVLHGATVYGSNPRFDMNSIDYFMGDGYPPTYNYSLGDIKALMVGYLAHEGEAPVSMDDDSRTLSKMVGVDPEDYEQHTALGDCRWVEAIYEKIFGPFPASAA